MSLNIALFLLGPPKLELDNTPVTVDRRKTLALLVYLASNRGRHSREYLSALLWPEYGQTKAFTNLRHTLWETQQVLGEGWIAADHETIGFITDADPSAGRGLWMDVASFESRITESRAQKDISLRISLLTDSVKLYRDHFLTGFSLKDAPNFNDWAFAESEELRCKLAGVLIMLSDDHCSLGQVETAIPYARRLITLDPFNESSHRRLMQIYIQAGQHNAALKQYQACEKFLRKELGVDPQPETRALYKQIRKGEFKSNQLVKHKDAGVPQHNIPFQLSKFIGREKELDEIKNVIADHRLVTLIGTGGIGKTRLSLEVGGQLLNDHANGVWLVELASLSDPARVPQTIAALFNLVEGSDESMTEKLVRVLRPKTILLILDNCEHLLDACAQLADTLLKNCPNLKILATSREALNISGEALYHVQSLTLPDTQQFIEKLLDYESIQLFEERARLVQEHFSLTMENASSIAQICHRLDGIPLAIELAAARVNMFSIEQLAAQLNESFNLLTSSYRTTLPRQQTLRASIDWSWNLLSDSERTLLRRLAVFAGGWTIDAAESVCAENGVESQQILIVMTQLVAKSLVVANQESGRERRYSLLEMIRQYAREKLVEAGEEENIHTWHLKYFLNLSEQIERELVGRQQMEWFARTNDERNNLRSAMEYASRVDVEAGLYISGRLRNFWEYFDNYEGAYWLAEFIQKPESNDYPLARAKALCTQGWFLTMSNQLSEARSAIEESLTLTRACGDQHGEVNALVLLGFITDGDKKSEFCQQALALARSCGDIVGQAIALNFLGWDHSDLKRALAYWEEAIPLYRQMENRRSLANCLGRIGYYLVMDGSIDSAQKYLDESNLLYQQLNISAGHDHLITAYGQIALMRGDYEKARSYFQENARIGREVGSRRDYLWANICLGQVDLREGNLTEARQVFAKTAQEFQKDGYAIGLVVSLECIASLYVAVSKTEYAARLIGWADATREGIGETRAFLEQADVDRDKAASLIILGKAAFEDAYDKGYAMTLDEAVEYALNGG
jgi:predicted ATPase/DNA-binding SARP family transcriptional activator